MASSTLSQFSASPLAPDGRATGIRRSFSYNRISTRPFNMTAHFLYNTDSIHTTRARMRRSYSDNHLVRAVSRGTITGVFKPFVFEDDEETKKMDESDRGEGDPYEKKRANWIERLLELRNNWKERQGDDDGYEDDSSERYEDDGESEGVCEVEYEEDDDVTIDREIFRSLLRPVLWSDTKHFSQLAFLCNMAYSISDLKRDDLKMLCGLDLVTSSLEKKAEAAAIKEQINQDSTRHPPVPELAHQKPILRSSAAYQIAASAASYVQSRAKGLISMGSNHQHADCYAAEVETVSTYRINRSEMAACAAASTMTAVVAAAENQKQKAAKDLQSLHSSPCEWFVCDDSSIYTRCFVIQGSDSLASWQANLLFEPTLFEGTDVLVHRGIYEGAKGIYDQFMPEIIEHIDKFGRWAKLQFTGHSLGGSLALLVNLMLLTRNVVEPCALLPVVTFGSPFIFCGGHRILEQLGFDDNHVRCVMMHRDIVPRAFSCNYPNSIAQLLKRLNGTFRSHPCLNKNRLLYSPIGKLLILQPDDKSSPPHPMLPPGTGLYALDSVNSSLFKTAVRMFLNSPHPLETLSDPTAYGSEGTIIRDHDSSNYRRTLNEVIKKHMGSVVRKARRQRNQLWPLLIAHPPPYEFRHRHCNTEALMQEVSKKALTRA